MSLKDEDIDKLYQDRSNDLSFDYKPKYWDAFNASLPGLMADGVVVDEVDTMYQQEAGNVDFPYKESYWTEMEAMLPSRRRADVLWFATSFVFIGLLFVSLFMSQNNGVNADTLLSEISLNRSNAHGSNTTVEQNTTMSEDVSSMTNIGISGAAQDDNIQSNSNVEEDIPAINEGNDSNTLQSELAVSTEAVQTELQVEEPIGVVTASTVLIEDKPIRDLNQLFLEENSTQENKETTNDVIDIREENLTLESVDNLATQNIPVNIFSPDTSAMRIPEMDLPVASAMYLEANGGVSQSLITPSDRTSTHVGIGFGAQFYKGNFTFTTGINGSVSFHDDLVLNRQAKVYGFGSEVYNYTIKFNQIYSLEANLSFGYKIGSHQFNIGIRPSYIVGTKVGFTKNSSTSEDERMETYGYTDGLTKFGLKPMIGYSFDISPNWTVGLNVGTQVMQTVNEDYINGTNRTLPIDGQLYIRKTISFRK